MMALFLVLWLTAQDERIKEAVERAFRHPFSSPLPVNVGIISPNGLETQNVEKKGGNADSSAVVELAFLRTLAQELLRLLPMEQDPNERTVELETTSDGIRLSIFDRSRKPVFQPQSTEFTPYGDWVLSTLAWPISTYTNLAIEVEGHTERDHLETRAHYGNWELSADRANAARRKLIEHGVGDTHINKVAGFADTLPLPNHSPEDEVNRRVTVVLKLRSDQPPS
jgi:chemotaxis protein MotB